MGGFRALEEAGLMETFRDPGALAERSDAFPLDVAKRAQRRALADTFLRSLDDPLAAILRCLEAAVPASVRTS